VAPNLPGIRPADLAVECNRKAPYM
jgi:hypothetical protein